MMKKKLLFFLMLCLIGVPLLMVACTSADVENPPATTGADATAPDKETNKPAATEPTETTSAETEAVTETDAETEADMETVTDPVTEPVTDATTEAVTEPETEPEEETAPSYLTAYIKGGEKLEQLLDYSDDANWIARPDNADKPVDVFFLYPTFYGTTNGAPDDVADPDNVEMRTGAEMLSLKGQASVFQDTCNIYMPVYRQLSMNGLMKALSSDSIIQYYLSRDVYRSLDYYFENCNNGKPFILAGHSQGSIWIMEILENYMREHPEYLDRMVAAYVIGYSVTDSYLAANPHLKFAESASDTGVIISYNTEGPGNSGKYNCVVSSGAIAINPLTWTRDDTLAPASSNPGSLNYQNQLEQGLADAKVDTARGVVVCSSVDPTLYRMAFGEAFGPESFHYYDYSLYYVSLRMNVATRVTAYFATHS